MFRRPKFRPIRRGIIANVPPALRHANQLLASGQFLEAAETYEELARGAHARGLPQEAQLMIIAGDCRLRLKQIDLAMADFRRGCTLVSLMGGPNYLRIAVERSAIELTRLGFTQEAREIVMMIGAPSNDNNELPKTHACLPANCQACGGALRPDEVDWIDESSAECPWCGSTVGAV